MKPRQTESVEAPLTNADDLSNNFGFLFDEERLYYVGVVKDANLPTDINSGEAKNKGGPTAPNTSELWAGV